MPIGHAINPGLAVLNTFAVAGLSRETRRNANGPAFFSYSLGYYYNPATGGTHKPGQGQTSMPTSWLAPEETAGAQAQRGGLSLRRKKPPQAETGRRGAKALPRRAQRQCHRHDRDPAQDPGQVRGAASGRDDLRRPVRRPQTRAHHGIHRNSAESCCREFKERHLTWQLALARRTAEGRRRLADQLVDLGPAMARPSDIRNDELRGLVEQAFAAMRAGKGAEAVRACADAYLRHGAASRGAETDHSHARPEISRLMRWPALGANMKPETVAAGAPPNRVPARAVLGLEAMTYPVRARRDPGAAGGTEGQRPVVQVRQHVAREQVGLGSMRIAGKDESLDPFGAISVQFGQHLVRIADDRCAAA